MLVMREFLGRGLTQAEISALHLEHFHRLEAEDLALPYSCMFSSDLYHRNRADLIGADQDGRLVSDRPNLTLFQLLLIDWLSERPVPALSARLTATLERLPASAGTGREQAGVAAGRTAIAAYATPRDLESLAQRGMLARLAPARRASTRSSWAWPARRAALRQAVRLRPSALHKRVMASKAYQGMNVVKREVQRRLLPHITLPTRARPRVALCVSGQLRGFKYANATWRERLLPGIEADTFVHSWSKIGFSGAEPWRYVLPFEGAAFVAAYREQCMSLSHDEVRERYPSLFGALKKGGLTTEGELRELYRTEHVVLEDDQAAKFEGWSNSKKMHYKIHACAQLARQSGREYDLIVKIRPDMPITYLGFSWSDLMRRCWSETLLMTEAALGVHYGVPMMGDQFAVGSPDAMSLYARTFELYPTLIPSGLLGLPDRFRRPHEPRLHGVAPRHPRRARSHRVVPLRDAHGLSTEEISSAVRADAGPRNDAWDRRLIAAIERDQVARPLDVTCPTS